jgi:hypothetical protein
VLSKENCLFLDFFQYDCRRRFPLIEAQNVARQICGLEGDFVGDVYNYWLEKRNALRKALMRKFQEPPTYDDASPYVAFRPREIEKRQTRLRKNDTASYRKLEFLRTKDLAELQNICANVEQRELHKRELVRLEAEIFDRKLKELTGVKNIPEDSKLSLYLNSSLPQSTFEPVS